MKILFATFGSMGDVHPYIAVALEAKRRGHEPIIATASKYRATVEALGLKFFPVRPDAEGDEYADLMARLMNSPNAQQIYCEEVLSNNARDSYADLLVAGEEADLFVSHPAALTAPLAARTLNKKWISSSIVPSTMSSAFEMKLPSKIKRLDRLGLLAPVIKKVLYNRHQRKTRLWFQQLDALRTEIGAGTKPRQLLRDKYSALGNLALFSRHFAPQQASWPKNTQLTGFCFYDAAQQAESNADWQNWLQSGETPIIFAPGSSSVWAAQAFWQASAEQIRHSNERGIFLTAGQNLFAGSNLKDKILELDYVPYSQIFPYAKLVVHAGGIGTMALALRAGKPQVIVPQAFDQFDNAARAQNCGFAINTNLPAYENGESFQTAFDRLDALKKQAEQLGEKIREEDGPLAACEYIERQF